MDYIKKRDELAVYFSRRILFLILIVIAGHIWLFKSFNPNFYKTVNVPGAEISPVNVNLIFKDHVNANNTTDISNISQQQNPKLENLEEILQTSIPLKTVPADKKASDFKSSNKVALLSLKTIQKDPAQGLSSIIVNCLKVVSFGPKAQICETIAPPIPKAATEEGFCRLRGDITEYGRVENLTIIECSDPVFLDPSLNAVQKCIYVPAVINGVRIEEQNREMRVKYKFFKFEYSEPIDSKFKKLTIDDLFK